MIHAFPKRHTLAAITVAGAIAIALIFSPSSQVNAKRTSVPIQLNNPINSDEPVNKEKVTSSTKKSSPQELIEPPLWSTFTIQNGDTLSRLFSRAGFNDKVMYTVLGTNKKNKKLTNLFPGQELAFQANDLGELTAIRLTRSPVESFIYTKSEDGSFKGEKKIREPEIHIAHASGTIENSLFLAGQKAGLSQSQIMELANIFGWDIDFILDIRSGDTFNFIYEELHLDGQIYKNGRILAANFSNQNRELSAVLYKQENGVSNYFTPDGKSMRKAFIRTPVDFARISSRFNLRRKHPILHKIRAHKGTDYAASRGTPIKATGDGKVIHASRKGGYGKTVIVQHGQKFTTLYAHMSKYAKGVKTGKRVKQGQTIGYIGSTGLASGPHLHYEFRVNGVHKNSLKVSLPHATPVPNKELNRFTQQTSTYLAQLETFNRNFQLAANP